MKGPWSKLRSKNPIGLEACGHEAGGAHDRLRPPVQDLKAGFRLDTAQENELHGDQTPRGYVEGDLR